MRIERTAEYARDGLDLAERVTVPVQMIVTSKCASRQMKIEHSGSV